MSTLQSHKKESIGSNRAVSIDLCIFFQEIFKLVGWRHIKRVDLNGIRKFSCLFRLLISIRSNFTADLNVYPRPFPQPVQDRQPVALVHLQDFPEGEWTITPKHQKINYWFDVCVFTFNSSSTSGGRGLPPRRSSVSRPAKNCSTPSSS